MRFLPNATTISAQRRKEHEVVSRCFGNGLMLASDCMSQAQSISVARRVSATERHERRSKSAHERRPESGTAILVEFDLMRSSAPIVLAGTQPVEAGNTAWGERLSMCRSSQGLEKRTARMYTIAGSASALADFVRARAEVPRAPKEPDGYEISSQRDNHVGTKAQGARSRVSLLS